MTNFFTATSFGTTDISLRCLGGISPALVNAAYPMEALTKFHYAHHIPGLTGRWMDTGATALGGTVKGTFHRLAHGHHLFEDGFKVVVNPNLKFGEFLHHLGMDSLTARGIPNPLLPTSVGEQLVKFGMRQQFVNELMTVNMPKILGGSVGLACAGMDVFFAFSDAIPHTFLAAGMHFGFGALDILLGLYPPNILSADCRSSRDWGRHCHNLPDDSRSDTPGGGSSRQCFPPSARPICGIGSTDWRVCQYLYRRLLGRRI